jgi:hypothetical protein
MSELRRSSVLQERAMEVLAIVFALAGVVSILKGVGSDLVNGVDYYWMLNYQHGFVKRALVGTFFEPLLTVSSFERLRPVILGIHVTACVLIVGMCYALLERAARRQTSVGGAVALRVGLLCLMCSPLMSSLGFMVGYLDVYFISLALAAWWLALDERYVAAALVAAAGPLIHESFVFLWSSVAVLLVWSCVITKKHVFAKLLAAALPAASAATAVALHNQTLAEAAIRHFPLAQDVKERAIYQMAFTFRTLLHHMMRYEYPGRSLNVATSAAYLLIPAIAILWAAAFVNWHHWAPRPWRTLLAAVAATLAPLTILALGWDLSRFLVWSTLAAGLVLIASGSPMLLGRAGGRIVSRRAIHPFVLNGVLVAVSIFYLLSPAIFAYPSEISMFYSRVPRWFARTVPARITLRIFDRYNANPPRAVRLNQSLSCFLIDDGATRIPGCAHEIRCGESVRGPQDLRIAGGFYTARFTFRGNDDCSSGDARLQVVTTGRFGKILAEYSDRIDPNQSIDVPFRLTRTDAALAALEFRAIGVSDCVLLTAVGWTRLPDVGP